MKIFAAERSFPLKRPFTISRGSRSEVHVLEVRIEADGHFGVGESVPYARYGETVEKSMADVKRLETPLDRRELQETLPPGAARNAVDCALWDLEAKRSGTRVWECADLSEPVSLTTAFTISLDSPERMRLAALENSERPLLKVKLGSRGDIPRLEAVRAGAPRSRIIVDANEGWSIDEFTRVLPRLVELGVEMIEQPFRAGEDDALDEIESPIAICADESCHDRSSLNTLNGRYSVINIKLDKSGGLTEALALRDLAVAQGFRIMVGCMIGSSLSMAPAVLVAQGADIVDLDGPLLLADDRQPAMEYIGSCLDPPEPKLWG